MAKLLSNLDSKVLLNVDEFKNAVFFKDMLAFYDAYENLMSKETSELPSFCYWNGNYSLEGICLFMRDYSAELGFETLDLNLNYIRILYYALASYSSDGEMPERSIVANEFENYKKVVIEKTKDLGEKKYIIEKKYNYTLEDYNKKLGMNIKNKTLQHTFNFLSIFFLLTGIFCVIAPFSFYFLNTLELIFASLISLACVSVGIAFFFIFRKLSKIYNATDNGSVYEMHSSKRAKNYQNEELEKILKDFGYVNSEKYECLHNLNELLFGKNRLSFEDVLKKAKEYKILSYNIKRDVLLLFKNQYRESEEICEELSKLSNATDAVKPLCDMYKRICEKDWLKYSSLIRYAFLLKYISVAEKNYNWELLGKGNINPFGVDIKSVAKEPVAFLKNRESLFVSSSTDKFINSNYLRNQNIFRLKKELSIEEFLNLKMAYTAKFFNYEKIKVYNNIFYDKKIGKGARVPEQIIENQAKIPTLIFLRLKLTEKQLSLENSQSEELEKVSKFLFSSDADFETLKEKTKEEIIEVDEKNIPKTIFECDEVIEVDGLVSKYRFGSTVVNGYKI